MHALSRTIRNNSNVTRYEKGVLDALQGKLVIGHSRSGERLVMVSALSSLEGRRHALLQ